MKILRILSISLFVIFLFGASGIPSGGGSSFVSDNFSFEGINIAKEVDTGAKVFKVLQGNCPSNAQSSLFDNTGTIYQVPIGKTYRVIGLIATNDTANKYMVLTYQDNSQTAAGRFTGTNQKTLWGRTAAAVSFDRFYGSVSTFENSYLGSAPVPSQKYITCVPDSAGTLYVKVYGYEE